MLYILVHLLDFLKNIKLFVIFLFWQFWSSTPFCIFLMQHSYKQTVCCAGKMRKQPLSWVNDSMRHIVFTTFSFSHRGRVAESSVNVPVFHVDNELCKQCTVVVLTVTEPGKYALPVKNDRWRLWNWAYTLKYITSWFQASVFAWVWHVCRGVGSLNVFFFLKKEGLGWALFFASLSSLEVECLSPPSPPLRAAGPRSGNKTG